MHFRPLILAAIAFAVLSPTFAVAQTVPPVPPSAAPTSLQPEKTPGATGPEAPVGAVTLTLEEKLRKMMSGRGLTSDVVVAKALSNSDELKAKRKAIEAAEWGVAEARAGFYPQLTLAARYTRLSEIDPVTFGGGTVVSTNTPTTGQRDIEPGEQLIAVNNPPFGFPVFENNFAFSAALNVPLSDYVLRLSKAVSAATQAERAAEYDEAGTRAAVARDARIAYYQWIRAQGTQFVAVQALAQAEAHLLDAKNAFANGLLSKADVLRAQSQLSGVALFVERSSTGVLLATERLRSLMRDYQTPEFEIGENIIFDLRSTASPDFESAYAAALTARPELRALAAAERGYLERAKLARRANYPRLDGQANLQYSAPNQRYLPPDDKFHATWDAGLVLSWTPTAIFGAEASAHTAEARAAELAAKRNALREALRLEIRSALQAVKEEAFAIDTTRQGLTAAEEGYRVRRELFRGGRATTMEVTDAETELTRARLEAVNAHVDYRIALTTLKHALGETVTSPPPPSPTR